MRPDEQLPEADWWTREMYAHFGLAIYFCQALELQLTNHLAAMRLGSRLNTDGIDELLRSWFSQTMGRHVREVREQLGVSEDTAAALDAALARRNWLVHHYFRSRIDRLATLSGQQEMAAELRGYQAQLQAADAALSAETRALMAERGLSEEAVAAVSEPFLASLYRGERPEGYAAWHDLFADREPPPP